MTSISNNSVLSLTTQDLIYGYRFFSSAQNETPKGDDSVSGNSDDSTITISLDSLGSNDSDQISKAIAIEEAANPEESNSEGGAVDVPNDIHAKANDLIIGKETEERKDKGQRMDCDSSGIHTVNGFDEIIAPESADLMEIVINSKDYRLSMNADYKFKRDQNSKLSVMNPDLSQMKSRHTAKVIQSFADNPYYAHSAWSDQYQTFIELMTGFPEIMPLDDISISEINNRVIKAAKDMPLFEMSPNGDRTCAKVAYGIATGACDLIPYLCADKFNHLRVEHKYSSDVSIEFNNWTRIARRKSADDSQMDVEFHHELSSYKKELLGNSFTGMTDKSPFYLSSWRPLVYRLFKIDMSLNLVLSQSSIAERQVTAMKGAGQPKTYSESFKVSLTENIDPQTRIKDLSIYLMILSLFDIDQTEANLVASSEKVGYVMSTIREYLYKQVYYKQGVSILEASVTIDISKKLDNPQTHYQFTQDVENGKFFLMTPLHCDYYTRGSVNERWHELSQLSAMANSSINSSLFGLSPASSVQDKSALRMALANRCMRESDSYVSPLMSKHLKHGSVSLSKKQVISEFISRIISRDAVPSHVKFFTKADWLGQDGMKSPIVCTPHLHNYLCKFHFKDDVWRDTVVDMYLMTGKFRDHQFSRTVCLSESLPGTFGVMFEDDF